MKNMSNLNLVNRITEGCLTSELLLPTPFLFFSCILAVPLSLDTVFSSLQAFLLYLSKSLANSYFFLLEPAAKEQFFKVHSTWNSKCIPLEIVTVFSMVNRIMVKTTLCIVLNNAPLCKGN